MKNSPPLSKGAKELILLAGVILFLFSSVQLLAWPQVRYNQIVISRLDADGSEHVLRHQISLERLKKKAVGGTILFIISLSLINFSVSCYRER